MTRTTLALAISLALSAVQANAASAPRPAPEAPVVEAVAAVRVVSVCARARPCATAVGSRIGDLMKSWRKRFGDKADAIIDAIEKALADAEKARETRELTEQLERVEKLLRDGRSPLEVEAALRDLRLKIETRH